MENAKTKRTREAEGRVTVEERWLTIDAGFNTPLEYTNYRWYFRSVAAGRASEPADTEFRLAGPPCDGGDVFAGDNDRVVFLDAGGYTLEMMSDYDRLSAKDRSRSMFHCNGGASAGSEPEVKVLLAQLGEGYDSVLSLHSHGGFFDANGPGGRSLARRMSAACGLKLDKVASDASITGSMGQFIPQEHKIPIVTVELEKPHLSQRMIEALLVSAQ